MTENSVPNPEAAVPYASAEQLGELYTKMNAWLVANGTYKVDDGMASYDFVVDADVVAGLLPEVPQVFPDVEQFALGYVPGRENKAPYKDDPDSCDFELKMRESSLYAYWDIDVSVSGIADDGRLLAEPHRDVELSALFEWQPPRSTAERVANLKDSFRKIWDEHDAGVHEIDMREFGALTNIVDNLDIIKQMQEG